LLDRSRILRAPASLFLTGLADVWGALRSGRAEGSQGSGLVLMTASAAAFALMAAFVKRYLPDAPIQSVVLSRGTIMAAIFVALARFQGAPILGKRPVVLLLRGLLGYAALSCYLWSVQHIPLGDAVLIQYSHPIFIAAIAPFLLHEPTSRGHWALVLMALCGVALIVSPSGEVRSAALVGTLGSMLSALAYVTVRDLSRTEHPLTILVWFPLATIPPSLIATLMLGRSAMPRSGAEVAGHLLVALSALVGQVALTLGLSRAGAARATAVTLTGPVFGLLFGYVFFRTVPTASSLLGTAIVLTAIGILGWRNAPRRIPSSA
jgi:drug/metabolite transporter (DMT)-like permease